MPLPLIIGIAAGIAGLTGVGSGISGGVKMKKANDKVKFAQKRNDEAQEKLKKQTAITDKVMDKLGKEELEIICSFDKFANYWEKIKNKPNIGEIDLQDLDLPKFDYKKLKEVSVAANVVMGSLGGAAVGTAGGFAAAGATTAAVMALGTASTGTAISTLSGAALTNATLAALGGGALSVGGGGIALGTAVLGGATLGVGFLVGGIVFNITGSKLSDKADKAWEQMKDTENKVNEACSFLTQLSNISTNYYNSLSRVKKVYYEKLDFLKKLVDNGNDNWTLYSDDEIHSLENLILLVQLLYKMCEVKIIINNGKGINSNEVNANIIKSNEIINKIVYNQ